MPTSRGPIWLVALVTLLVYAPILGNDFVSWDDGETIYNNPRLNPATVEKNLWYWSHPENGEYLPLTRSVWAMLTPVARLKQPDDHGITLNPWIYHGVSLIAHTASALLVYFILIRMLRVASADPVAPPHSRGPAKHPAAAPRQWPAAAGALLFAIHPLQVESVAWASGLKDLFFGLFGLAAILAYLCYCQEPRHRTRFYILGLLALLASILSKPMGVIIPLLVAVLGWRLHHRPFRQLIRELTPWFALSLIFGLLARHWMPAAGIPTTTPWARPLIATDSLAFYMCKLIWPASLAIDYGRTPLVVMSSGWGLFTWLVPAGVAVLLWRVRRQHPLPGLGAAIATLAALPILGLLPHMFQYYSTVADHYLYLPMLGVAIVAAYGLTLVQPRTAGILAGCVLTALGIRSMAQTQHWTGNRQFWNHTLTVNPNSYVAMVSLAQEMMGKDANDVVANTLQQALKLNPNYLVTHQTLVDYYTMRRQIDPAIAHLRRGLEIMETIPDSQRPDLAPQYLALAELLLARGRPAEAFAAAEKARQMNPGNPSISNLLGRIRAATTRPATLPADRR